MATILRDGNLGLLDGKVAVIGYGSQGHAHALNLRDSGVQVQVGLREGSPSWGEAEATGLAVGTVADAVAGAQLVAILLPDQVQPQVFSEHVEPNLAPGARCCSRTASTSSTSGSPRLRARRDHGRAERAGPRRPPPLHRGLRHAGADRGRAGRLGQCPRDRARLRRRDRRRTGRHPRDDLQGGDRDRPVRRAGRALRRHLRARARRIRDPRRGGLRAGDRLLRVPPRAEADRRPDVRERSRRDALLDLRHGRVRRLHARQARDRRARARAR